MDHWEDQIDELNVEKTYPPANTDPALLRLMNSARNRAMAALREARVERNRRRRLKGEIDMEVEEVPVANESDDSNLSDLESDFDDVGEDAEEGDEGVAEDVEASE